jgi:ATP-dependent RNA helicase DeaD
VDVFSMPTTFKELPLAQPIQKILDDLGFTEPTDIQKKALPVLMESHKIDFHGQAQTGTGKTLAFGLPLLHRIDVSKKVPQALIVAPTRELAVQIKESIAPFARAMDIRLEAIYGGVSMEAQTLALKRGCHIVVGTPGRLNDHLRRGILKINTVRTLVLDEADIMLDMGFKEEVDEILRYAPVDREIWLFSATVKSGIATIMKTHMQNPVSVRVVKKPTSVPLTKQYFCVVPGRTRLQVLSRFIECATDFYGFIFCQTKILTSEVAEKLIKLGYNVGALHGDMSQLQRNLVIKKFKNKEITMLVATDVAARGIDVANLTHVINYSLPEDHESYIHRVGRTGRAGKDGIAITLLSKTELRALQFIQQKFQITIDPINVPDRDTIVKARLEETSRYLAQISEHVSPESMSRSDQQLEHMVSQLSPDEQRVVLVRVLHDKFLSSLGTEDLNFTPSSKVAMPDELQELFMNVGSDDGVTRDQVLACLTSTGLIKEDQIQKIRVINRRTFIQLPAECAGPLINALRGAILGGRRVRASIIEEESHHSRPRRRYPGKRNY